jgi:tetratricopeptide (TPR) repeat protein
MKRVLLILSVVWGFSSIMALEPVAIVKEANELYKKGFFSQSASKYQLLVDSGYQSSELFYNLGNAYFKANDNKSAILYYEKAKLLSPGDKDLEYNLAFARSKVVDKIEAIPDLFFIDWFRSFRNHFSADFWSLSSIFFFILALSGFLFYFFSVQLRAKKISFWGGVIVLFFAILSFAFAYGRQNTINQQRTAIIFVQAVTVKSTPSETGTSLFVLHEGTKVEIIDKVDNWHKIKIPDGNQGWIKITDLAKI